jgi:hypothetical protein
MDSQPDSQPTMQDSVVGRDLHTGNVIHNHYHTSSPQALNHPPPNPQIIHQPQPIYIQQVVAPSPNPIYVHYKNYHSGDWIAFGYLALIATVFTAGACGGFSFCVSLVGVLTLLPQSNLATKQPGHPEAGKIGHAITVNLIAVAVGLLAVIFFTVISSL